MKLNSKIFLKKYLFRIAKISDRKKIMNFIKIHWNKKHILSKNDIFFKYQFLNKKKLNFILAINKNKKKIEAIQGFIPYCNGPNKNICGSISCVDNKNTTPFLGVETMKQMFNLIGHKKYFGIGTNPKTMIPLVKFFFKRFVGKMDHFYIINNQIKNYKIAKIIKKKKIIIKRKSYKLKKISNFKELSSTIDLNRNYPNLPYKNALYLKKRYFEHPIYKYDIYLILKNELNSRSFIVTREIFYKKNRALSIIDFVGEINDLSKIGKSLNTMMTKNKYEYIDILCTNINRKILNNSNFIYKFENDKNIIPIYFQPFVKKNTTVWYESSKKKIILFKGDADQDTPRY